MTPRQLKAPLRVSAVRPLAPVRRVVVALEHSGTVEELHRAERSARRLKPLDQLHVVDALRAARARLGVK